MRTIKFFLGCAVITIACPFILVGLVGVILIEFASFISPDIEL